MSRTLWAGLLAALVVTLVIVLTLTSSRLPRGVTLHEDPAAVPVDSDPTAIFELYLTAASRLTSWQFVEGRRLVAELNRAGLPPELQSLVEDVNAMLIKEGSILEAADAWLREASALIESGNVDEANPLLRQIEQYAARGNVLLDQINEAIRLLGQRANVESLPPDAPTRRAYEEVQRLAARAQAVLAAYRAMAKDPRSVAAATRLLPYATRIDLSLPSSIYPGRPFTITGRLREEAPQPSRGRRVTLLLDRQVIGEVRAEAFRATLTLPAAMLPGRHLLAATSPAQGRYLRGRTERTIVVTQAVPSLAVHGRGHAMAPGQYLVTGRATSEFGPVAGAVVRARAGRLVAQSRTSETGEFQMVLPLAGWLDLVGPERLSVVLLPTEPWIATARVESDLFVVNLLGAGLVGLALPALAVVVAGRRRNRRHSLEEPPAAPAAAPAAADQSGAAVPVTGRARVLAAYLAALPRVEAASGVRMAPHTTVREFASLAGRLGADDPFRELTRLAELALYSRTVVTDVLARRAEELSRAVS